MFTKSSLFKCLLLTSLLGISTACNPNADDSEADAAVPDTNSEIQAWTGHALPIPLEEVSDKCLNVQKYFETLGSLSPATKARKITTDFKFKTTGASVPRNFLLRMAAGNFEVLDTDLAALPDFSKVAQTDCKNVIFAAEGHNEVYEITQARKDSLTLKNEWKGQLVITWKTPQSMEIRTTSVTGDFLCSPNSKGEVTTTSQISWGDTSVFTETLSEGLVSSTFLSLVAEATGTSMQSLYSSPISSTLAVRADEGLLPINEVNEEPPVTEPPATEEPVVEEPVVEDPAAPPPTDPNLPPTDPNLPPPPPIRPIEPVVEEVPVTGRPLVVNRLKALDGTPVRPDLLQCY